jgi:CheY-like chemotaxis protein
MKALEIDDPKTWEVLIVEDIKDSREVLTQILEFHGVQVHAAENGAVGLKMLETLRPHIILMDLSMPEIDGWEMTTLLRERPETQNIPVIALTAHALHEDREHALASGFDGYLVKPIRISTIIMDIRKILTRLSRDLT